MTSTILLAEDDDDDALLIRRALRKADIDVPVHVVRDGVAAADYLSGVGPYADRERYPFPGLLLLDIKMPHRSGLEVLGWLRAQPAIGHLPVVVLTASREARDVERAFELGADSYVVKPGSAEEYLAVARAIGLHWLGTNEPPTEP